MLAHHDHPAAHVPFPLLGSGFAGTIVTLILIALVVLAKYRTSKTR
jgi:hypothetical protein